MSIHESFCAWECGCRRKTRYSKARHANGRIQHILRLSGGYAAGSLRPYRCRFCGGWHFGHVRVGDAGLCERGE